MKSMFPGYYRPSDDDFAELWEKCTFIFDTNILLNLYRYSENSRNEVFEVFEKISDRLWIPHQVALEFQENRLSVNIDRIKKIKEVEEHVKTLETSVEQFNQLASENKWRHFIAELNPTDFIKNISITIQSFKEDVASLTQKDLSLNSDNLSKSDGVRDRIDNLLDGKVGDAPSKEELDNIYENGKERLQNNRPPGYIDYKEKNKRAKENKSDKEKDRNYIFNGLTFRREFGDLILWKEILKYVKEKNIKYIIFITDDEKEDWWWSVNSEGAKTVGPRHELVEEILSEGEVTKFYMYKSWNFLEYAKQYLNTEVKNETIEQVRDIAHFEFIDISYLKGYALKAAFKWLKSIHLDSNFIVDPYSTPNITVEIRKEGKIGYQVYYVGYLEFLYTEIDKLSSRIRRETSSEINYQVILVFKENTTDEVIENAIQYISQSSCPISSVSVGVLILNQEKPNESEYRHQKNVDIPRRVRKLQILEIRKPSSPED